MTNNIIAKCAVCGHQINIFLGKGGNIPIKIGYFGKTPWGEYWECAICFIDVNGEIPE